MSRVTRIGVIFFYILSSFANDDGSSRQEVGAPDAIRGSYSFVTPEGEQVSGNNGL